MNSPLIVQLIISSIVTIGFYGIIILYVIHPAAFETAAKEPLLILTGTLGTSFGGVVAWAIQSNIGSARTKELLAKAQPIVEEECEEPNERPKPV